MSELLSVRSGLPVKIPSPGLLRSSEREVGITLPGLKLATGASSQPRFVFSIPYNAACAVKLMPGGKCTPLMKRMVREESGPSPCEKNEAVRASAIATSFESWSWPKLPTYCAGASGLRYSARTSPRRLVTAMTSVLELIDSAAACTTAATSA